jgi:hypothetical protein
MGTLGRNIGKAGVHLKVSPLLRGVVGLKFSYTVEEMEKIWV